MRNITASPTVINCVFSHHTSDQDVFFNSSSANPTFSNCRFSDNVGDCIVSQINSRPTLTNCSFSNNLARSIAILSSAGSVVTNCYFSNNRSRVITVEGSLTLQNSSFIDNTVTDQGVLVINADQATVTNCRFQNNSATAGAIISYSSTNTVFTNCSFSGNTSPIGLFRVYLNAEVTLTNCILWGNQVNNTLATSRIGVNYSLVGPTAMTGYTGTNNMIRSSSPFISSSDLQLRDCSPAINAGLNSASGLAGITTDLAGNPRLYNEGTIDLGAYEYQAPPSQLSVTNPGVSTATVGQAFSQSFQGSGSTASYSFSVASGSLPTGLSLSTLGVLSGTPSQSGSFSITVQVTTMEGCAGVSSPYNLLVNEAASPIRYVKPIASGTGDGSNWDNASSNLQAMIDATGVQQVWVAAGTYKPTTGTDRSIGFVMKNDVAIYGGFVGTETSLDQRPPVNPITGPGGASQPSSSTLSGDIGALGDATDNSYHVIFNKAGLTSTAVLDGFVITGGNANLDNRPHGFGGGLYTDAGGPTIVNCRFQNNFALYSGGGVYLLDGSNGRLTNCSFVNNSSSFGGGMGTSEHSNPRLINCSFQGNSATNQGGGLSCGTGSNTPVTPSLINCSFLNNTAANGGGIENYRANSVLTNCSFLNNSATGQGGGMTNVNGSRVTLINCVLFGNGGANTFNRVPGSNLLTVRYSLVEPTVSDFTNDGTTKTTPFNPFISSSSTQLNACSPAINAGLSSASGLSGITTDLAGNPRFYGGGTVDMGAYEYQGEPTLITVTSPALGTATVGQAFSQDFTASGGSGLYSFSVGSGALPTGLGLASTGVLSGTPTQAGSFSLTVQATDATGCQAASAVYSLQVNSAAPTLSSFAATSGTVCVGSPAMFTATVANLTGSYGYTLTNGTTKINGTATSTAFSQTLVASGSGSQSFTLVVSNEGGLSVATTMLTVVAPSTPTLSASPSTTLTCAQTSLTLTAGGGSSYTFANGSGVLGTPGSTNTLEVTEVGIYSVSVANESGCVSMTNLAVSSSTEAPLVSISSSSLTLTCMSPTASLSVIGTGTIHWSTGESTSTISVSTAATYSVTLTSATGCSATTSVAVSSAQTPPSIRIAASPSLTISQGSSVTLTASGVDHYRWSTGETWPVISVSTAGTYSVTGIIGICSSVTSVVVSVSVATPTIGGFMASPGAVCVGSPVSFSATVANVTGSYTYTLTNGSSPLTGSSSTTAFSQSLPASGSGGQSFTLTVSSNGQSATATTTLTVNSLPVFTVNPTSVTLTTTSPTASLSAIGSGNLLWSTGQTTPVISVTASGLYSVTLTNASGCSTTATVPVFGADLTATLVLPQANFGQSGTAVVGNFVVNVFEVGGLPTSSGTVRITVTAPVGYTLSFPASLTSISVSGGSLTPINNGHWAVSQNLANRQLTLTMTSGAFIGAGGESSLGFQLTRTTANSGSTSSITVNVADDLTMTYDGNLANNVYARIISGL